MHNCCCIVKNRICVGIFIKQLPRVGNVAPTRTEKLCWSETVCNKTRDLLTRIDWKFYVLERLWSWHVLVIDNDYDHGICWRSIVSMIMTCVGDQEWLWSWHVLAIKLIRTNEETDQNKCRNWLGQIIQKWFLQTKKEIKNCFQPKDRTRKDQLVFSNRSPWFPLMMTRRKNVHYLEKCFASIVTEIQLGLDRF